MDLYQQNGNPIASGSFQATTTATLAVTLAATLLASELPKGLPGSVYSYSVTNNDPTNNVFLAYQATSTSAAPSTTNYWKKLAPGQSIDTSSGVGCLRRLMVVADAGTPNVHLEVFG